MSTDTKEMDEAFRQSIGHEFDGKKIGPFTPQRQAVASDMGMVWPWMTKRDRVSIPVKIEGKTVDITHYKQSYRDSVLALWLCLQSAGRVDDAEADPGSAKAEAWKWAETIGLNQNSPKAGEALIVWMQITREITTSHAQPQQKHRQSKGDDEPGEL